MRIVSTHPVALVRRCFSVLLAAAFFVPLTAMPDAQAASGRLRYESGGQARTAFVIERERLKRRPRPTVLFLHGPNTAVLRTRRNLGLEEAIRSAGVAIVYPDAVDGRWDLTGPRDVQALRDLIRKLVDQRITDRRRVYLLGVSTGGMMAMRFACENADATAGVSSMLGLMPEGLAASCKPSKPVPFALLAGTADQVIPFNGGPATLRDFRDKVASAQATLAPFKAAAGCSEETNQTAIPDRDPKDNSRVYVETFKGCKAPIELVRVEGGGHSLPGRGRVFEAGTPGVARNNDVDGARLIWDFLRRAGA